MSLGLGKRLETLHLITDGTFHFKGLATNAVTAFGVTRPVDGVGTLDDDGITEIFELSLGEGCLHANSLAGLTFNPTWYK